MGAGEARERRVGVHAPLRVKGTREEGGVSGLKLPDLAYSSNARDVAVRGRVRGHARACKYVGCMSGGNRQHVGEM